MKNKKLLLSVVLATRNEEKNIGPCLERVKDIADEIIVFDEYSTDRTREIAKKYGAKVIKYQHKTNFHETKQKAIEKAKWDWILQLDADERVTPELAKEIKEVINMNYEQIKKREIKNSRKERLFKEHEELIRKREDHLGKSSGDVVAFFIPRKNIFLGAPLIHAGVYPDGVIRLIRRGYARLPAKSVHELMEVEGEVGWLFNDLEHHESPTLKRYLDRMDRYTDLHAEDLKRKNVPVNVWNFIKYSLLLPTYYFLLRYFRHLGFLDGIRGFLWSFLSALHFPIAYFKYWSNNKK